jgi:malate dehydrogenase (oxaloacetate-decarboxylating)
MMMAAAHALASAVDAKQFGDSLLPPLAQIRLVSRAIAIAVGDMAIQQGHADPKTPQELEVAVDRKMWQPEYRSFTI